MKINEYLLERPHIVEGLFTKIFGKYMLRYYDQSGYVVEFSDQESTSYQDETNKRIVIALDNVIAMLKKDINVLAIAYHELAHTLYTDNKLRDKLKHKALQAFMDDGSNWQKYTNDTVGEFEIERAIERSHVFHKIWNVLEDTRIERLMADEFPFLREIIEPLKTIIEPGDDDLFKWRVGEPCDSEIQEWAETFCSPKKMSQVKRSQYMTHIFKKLYADDLLGSDVRKQPNVTDTKLDEYEDTSDSQEERANQKRQKYLEQEYQQTQDKIEQLKQRIENEKDTLDKDVVKGIQEYIDDLEENAAQASDAYEQRFGKQIDEHTNPTNAKQELEYVKSLDTESSQDQAIKSMLESIQTTIVNAQDDQDYARSVQHYDPSRHIYTSRRIRKVYSPKQKLRQGMSAAMQKRYTLDLSNKVNVSRIVSSKANKTAPQVFYNRGKDIGFTKKVVVFEDVSSSTTAFTNMFSSIAYSLSQAFDSVEWWGYGDKLFLKQPKDYSIPTLRLGREHGMEIGGTRADRLLSVMKKYRNKDYTYVIITDGDMTSIFDDIDTWEYFKNKVAVVGFLDKRITKHAPHHVNIAHDIAKAKGYKVNDDDSIRDIFMYSDVTAYDMENPAFTNPLIVKSVNGVMQLVKSRLN